MGRLNQEGTILSEASLADDAFSDWIETRHVNAGGLISISWADASATDAVVKLQEAVDKTVPFDVSSKSVTIAAASGTGAIRLAPSDVLGPWIRLAIVANTETTGTVTAKHFLRGE